MIPEKTLGVMPESSQNTARGMITENWKVKQKTCSESDPGMNVMYSYQPQYVRICGSEI